MYTGLRESFFSLAVRSYSLPTSCLHVARKNSRELVSRYVFNRFSATLYVVHACKNEFAAWVRSKPVTILYIRPYLYLSSLVIAATPV
jgi:hypothetical protein